MGPNEQLKYVAPKIYTQSMKKEGLIRDIYQRGRFRMEPQRFQIAGGNKLNRLIVNIHPNQEQVH